MVLYHMAAVAPGARHGGLQTLSIGLPVFVSLALAADLSGVAWAARPRRLGLELVIAKGFMLIINFFVRERPLGI